jgi:GNAT superfamily N-acetyltransferase
MCRSTTIRKVSYAEILGAPNAQELIDEYGAECALPQIGAPDPQPQTYRTLENAGLMQCFGVFDGDKLVGFAAVLTSVFPVYGQRVATVEGLFVASAYRPGGVGRALMLSIEEHSIQSGCIAIMYTAPTHSQLDQLLDASHSYQHTNNVYCRRLG